MLNLSSDVCRYANADSRRPTREAVKALPPLASATRGAAPLPDGRAQLDPRYTNPLLPEKEWNLLLFLSSHRCWALPFPALPRGGAFSGNLGDRVARRYTSGQGRVRRWAGGPCEIDFLPIYVHIDSSRPSPARDFSCGAGFLRRLGGKARLFFFIIR